MKRLTKIDLLTLASQVPVLDEKEQRQILGGTDDSNGIPTPTATTTGVVIPEPYAPPTEETTPGTTSTAPTTASSASTATSDICDPIVTSPVPTTTTTTTTTTTSTGSIDASTLTGDMESAIMDIFNSSSGDTHYSVNDDLTTSNTNNDQQQNNLSDGQGNNLTDPKMDEGYVANIIMSNLDSEFEKKCFLQYWHAKGNMELSQEDFKEISQIAKSQMTQECDGYNVTSLETCSTIEINGVKYYAKQVNLYNSSKYNLALGTATVFFNSNLQAVGFQDTYDFDWHFLAEGRSLDAELKTRLVSTAGLFQGAKSYSITYGIHK